MFALITTVETMLKRARSMYYVYCLHLPYFGHHLGRDINTTLLLGASSRSTECNTNQCRIRWCNSVNQYACALCVVKQMHCSEGETSHLLGLYSFPHSRSMLSFLRKKWQSKSVLKQGVSVCELLHQT